MFYVYMLWTFYVGFAYLYLAMVQYDWCPNGSVPGRANMKMTSAWIHPSYWLTLHHLFIYGFLMSRIDTTQSRVISIFRLFDWLKTNSLSLQEKSFLESYGFFFLEASLTLWPQSCKSKGWPLNLVEPKRAYFFWILHSVLTRKWGRGDFFSLNFPNVYTFPWKEDCNKPICLL